MPKPIKLEIANMDYIMVWQANEKWSKSTLKEGFLNLPLWVSHVQRLETEPTLG